MDGSPSSIITMGYSTGSFSPAIGLVVTLGYGIGEADTSLNIEPTESRRLPSRLHNSWLVDRAINIRLPFRPHDIGQSDR